MTRKPGITIVGAGNLGSALALGLRRAGYSIDEVVGRGTPRSRRRAQALAGKARARATTIGGARLSSPVAWICVNDDAIAACAGSLARIGNWKNKIVLHSSGALSSDVLQALRRKGASVASAHPMMTFTSDAPVGMKNIPVALEGEARAVEAARQIARDLGAEPFVIAKKNKVLYHAMGSFSSPLIIAVLALAEQLAQAAGIPRKSIPKVMQPILRRTLENYFSSGAKAAFSGPINRGDVETVRKHLAALRRVAGAREIYLALLRSALRTLPVKNRKKLATLIRE